MTTTAPGRRSAPAAVGHLDADQVHLGAHRHRVQEKVVAEPAGQRLPGTELDGGEQDVVQWLEHEVQQPAPEVGHGHALTGRGEQDLNDPGVQVGVRVRTQTDPTGRGDREREAETCHHRLPQLSVCRVDSGTDNVKADGGGRGGVLGPPEGGHVWVWAFKAFTSASIPVFRSAPRPWPGRCRHRAGCRTSPR